MTHAIYSSYLTTLFPNQKLHAVARHRNIFAGGYKVSMWKDVSSCGLFEIMPPSSGRTENTHKYVRPYQE